MPVFKDVGVRSLAGKGWQFASHMGKALACHHFSRKNPVAALEERENGAPKGHRLLFTQLSWLREGGSSGNNPGLEPDDLGHITTLCGCSCLFCQKG